MSKIVLITGASSGIGKSTAAFLASKNYTVYGTGRTPKSTADDPYTLLPLDVTKIDSIEKVIQHIIDQCSGVGSYLCGIRKLPTVY